MSRKCTLMVLSMLLLVLSTEGAFAQKASFAPNAGISKDMRSVTSNRWNMGFNLGVTAFWQVSGVISLGGRVAYHSWGADADGWAEDYAKDNGPSYTYAVESSSGSQSVIEIVPSMKIATSSSDSPTKLDIQLGVGIFLVSPSDVTVSGSYRSAFSSGHITVTFGGESLTGFGFQAGLPLTISGRFQVLPLYSLYWAGGDAYHHITINAGIVL
ncbi:MAG: hypothetical protein Q8P51_14935 [Ignavibacteria bacterium]|nr:hypothetical protein [Ignavibacteria bacterium]